ncbi:MAG: CinA family protein [Xanthobacteraceae bacterium]
MIDAEVRAAALQLVEDFTARRLTIATAESCTGGLVAGALTEIPGSSSVVLCGFVTYSNEAKQQMLGVPSDVIETRGAVSRETAVAMANGALDRSNAIVSVAITGIAGPGGGSPEKPVGLVQFAAAKRGGRTITRELRFGDIGRGEVRRRSVLIAFEMLREVAAD